MNRRKFFGAVAAAVTAACVPDTRIKLRGVPLIWDHERKGAGFIAARYGSQHAWWRPKYGAALREYQIQSLNGAESEARVVAALQTAWRECLSYKSGDVVVLDEQAYEVFKTLQE